MYVSHISFVSYRSRRIIDFGCYLFFSVVFTILIIVTHDIHGTRHSSVVIYFSAVPSWCFHPRLTLVSIQKKIFIYYNTFYHAYFTCSQPFAYYFRFMSYSFSLNSSEYIHTTIIAYMSFLFVLAIFLSSIIFFVIEVKVRRVRIPCEVKISCSLHGILL